MKSSHLASLDHDRWHADSVRTRVRTSKKVLYGLESVRGIACSEETRLSKTYHVNVWWRFNATAFSVDHTLIAGESAVWASWKSPRTTERTSPAITKPQTGAEQYKPNFSGSPRHCGRRTPTFPLPLSTKRFLFKCIFQGCYSELAGNSVLRKEAVHATRHSTETNAKKCTSTGTRGDTDALSETFHSSEHPSSLSPTSPNVF